MRRPEKLRENLALLGVDPNDSRIRVVAGDPDLRGGDPVGGERPRPGHPRRRSVIGSPDDGLQAPVRIGPDNGP